MRRAILLIWLAAAAATAADKPQNPWDPNYKVTEATARAIERAAPDRPIIKPARARKLLVYGRLPTHPQSVACCFKAVEVLGRKTGAFETVASGDPLVFLPESLRQFDAVLMNNTHEQHPMLPLDFARLSPKEQAAAKAREPVLQKSLLDFVAGGKGVIGIHAAIAGGWPEYGEMMGGSYGGHFTGQVWLKADDADHPLCAVLKGPALALHDEIYCSPSRDFRASSRVLLSVDLARTGDPQRRSDGDYAVSWVRTYDKGRVFYCSLGHDVETYHEPLVLRHCLAGIQFALGDLLAETTPQRDERRRAAVERRRKGPHVICHRGASELACENTLEAYRATFELGGDGNEVDVRMTRDGVLACFHDDVIGEKVQAWGQVSDYTWEELQRLRFRDPGRFGEQSRFPSLAEVFDLHRQHGGLLHLDIKQPGIDQAVADLLTRMNLWDHVVHCNAYNAEAILRDPRLRQTRYKAPGMWGDHAEIFPDLIAAALRCAGEGIIVDEPRPALLALGRKLGPLSDQPVARAWRAATKPAKRPDEAELIRLLMQENEPLAETPADKAASVRRIMARAQAAEQLLAMGANSPEALAALEHRVRNRTLHRDWAWRCQDGAAAVRALILLRAPNALEVARFVLWRDDPALEPLIDPRYNNPRAWGDGHVKSAVFPAMEKLPGEGTERLCRDYLALPAEQVRRLGWPAVQESAGKTLLTLRADTPTALELMKHPSRAVRGRAILDCLARCDEPWARSALDRGASFALGYRTSGGFTRPGGTGSR